MDKFQSAIKLTKGSTYVLLAIIFTGCSLNTTQNYNKSSTKMAHQTTILNHQTYRSIDATSKNSSNVNFEYEEIITQ